jgi:uncharacterized membrane protein YfcA
VTLLLAAALGLLVGLTMGALGGGGSILTVPALVYVVGESARSATTASLVIVGVTAAAAVVGHGRAGRIRWGAGLALGAAGVAASFAGTALNARVDPDLLLGCFAVLMLVAAAAMLGRSRPETAGAPSAQPAPRHAGGVVAARVALVGLAVGFLTGFLGVGGGFLVVPALVLLLGYPMPIAVGTSLLVISLNSAVALIARAGTASFHWSVIGPFTAAAVAGAVAGALLGHRVSGPRLTQAFAGLLLAVAGYVLVRISLG